MTPAPYTLLCEDVYVFAKSLATQIAVDRSLRPVVLTAAGMCSCIFGLAPDKVFIVPSINNALYRITALNPVGLRVGLYNSQGATVGSLSIVNVVIHDEYVEADIVYGSTVHNIPPSGYVMLYSSPIVAGTITMVPRPGTNELSLPGSVTANSSYVRAVAVVMSHGNAVYPNAVAVSNYPVDNRWFTTIKLQRPLASVTSVEILPTVINYPVVITAIQLVGSRTLTFTASGIGQVAKVVGIDLAGAAFSFEFPLTPYNTPAIADAALGNKVFPGTYGFMPNLGMDTPYVVNRCYVASTGTLYLESTCPLSSISGSAVTTDSVGIETTTEFTASTIVSPRVLSAALPHDAVAVRCSVDLVAALGVGGRPTPLRRHQPGMYSVQRVYSPPTPTVPRQHLDSLPDAFCVPHVLTVASPDGHTAVPRVQMGNFVDQSIDKTAYMSWHDIRIVLFNQNNFMYKFTILWSDLTVEIITIAAAVNDNRGNVTEHAASDKFIVAMFVTSFQTQVPTTTMVNVGVTGDLASSSLAAGRISTKLVIASVPGSLRFTPEEATL